MAMKLVQDPATGLRGIQGVTRGGGSFFLGRRHFTVGRHWVGFDDSFAEPLVVRALYQPDDARLNRLGAAYAGYMQFAQLTFCGQPVPPSVLGGRLAERGPYVTAPRYQYGFVDFMGPAEVNARWSPELSTDPFYPLNALEQRELEDFGGLRQHGLPCGSLYFPGQVGPNATLAPTLVGQVWTGLKTEAMVDAVVRPDRAQLLAALALDPDGSLLPDTPLGTVILAFAVSEAALAATHAYRLALDVLTEHGYLDGLVESQVAGEVLGPYVLLTLPDPENEPAVLCIYDVLQGGRRYVVAHLLSADDVDGMDADAGAAALLRAHEHCRAKGLHWTPPAAPAGGAGTRGLGGLTANPFAGLPPYPFALHYHTVAVAHRRRNPRTGRTYLTPLGGFAWSVLLHFDEDTRRIRPAAIRAPRAIDGNGFDAVLARYRQALAFDATAKIDISNFTRAALRRDSMAPGPALRFVDLQDNDVL